MPPFSMPIRFDKKYSTHLFKFVNLVKASYNPYDIRHVSTAEVVKRLSAPRYVEANPKFRIDVTAHQRATAPCIEFHFVNDTQYVVHPADDGWCAEEIIWNVHMRAQELETEFDIEGKDIDNM